MTDPLTGARDEEEQPATEPPVDELAAWLGWMRQFGTTATDLGQLLRLELRLARGDSFRLAVVSLALLPVATLAWLAVCGLLAWLALTFWGSVLAALLTFLALQLLALMLMLRAARRYRRSLSLPATRRQLRLLLEDLHHGEQAPPQPEAENPDTGPTARPGA